MIKLRRWQAEAVQHILDNLKIQDSFLIVAGGGSGKTMFACALMFELRKLGYDRFIVVSPSYSVKRAFASTSVKFGIQLDITQSERMVKGFQGLSMTYAALKHTEWLAQYVTDTTLVILDEPHHLELDEDSAWYRDTFKILGGAGTIVMMTGTPWRSGSGRIPFCNYQQVGRNKYEIVPDYSYPYAAALRDNVVARARFKLCRGVARWEDKKGEHNITLGIDPITDDLEPKVLRALLRVGGEYYDGMLSESLAKLKEVRTFENNYALLILCLDVEHARETLKRLREKFGVNAALAVGDDSGSHKIIEDFKTSRESVIVSVRQVSEGTDIVRVKVITFASDYRTFLFFSQVMYRGARKTVKAREEFYMFVPAIPTFMLHARMVEEEVTHVITERLKAEKEEGGESVGVERLEGFFEWKGTEYLEADNYDTRIYEDLGEDNPPLLSDIRDGLRQKCNELVTKFAGKVKAAKGADMGEIIKTIHSQSNQLVADSSKVKKISQEEMSEEELKFKIRILETWLKARVK